MVIRASLHEQCQPGSEMELIKVAHATIEQAGIRSGILPFEQRVGTFGDPSVKFIYEHADAGSVCSKNISIQSTE